MKISEAGYRSLFKGTIIIKGLIAAAEIVFGLLFTFMSYDAFFRLASALTGDELTEHPSDFLWGFVIKGFHSITMTPAAVWAFILLSHGLVKLVLIVALLYDKEWAYPWSAAIFSGFIVYQVWQMVITPSAALAFITALDVLVVALVLHESRARKRRRRETAAVVL